MFLIHEVFICQMKTLPSQRNNGMRLNDDYFGKKKGALL